MSLFVFCTLRDLSGKCVSVLGMSSYQIKNEYASAECIDFLMRICRNFAPLAVSIPAISQNAQK